MKVFESVTPILGIPSCWWEALRQYCGHEILSQVRGTYGFFPVIMYRCESWTKEMNPEYFPEGLLLKLKLQYFGHLTWRIDSLKGTLMLRKNWGQEEKGVTQDEMIGWHHWLRGHEFEQILVDSEGQGSHMCCNPWVTKSQTWLRDWKTTNVTQFYIPISNI